MARNKPELNTAKTYPQQTTWKQTLPSADNLPRPTASGSSSAPSGYGIGDSTGNTSNGQVKRSKNLAYRRLGK
jgi:hypothetical protein